MERKVDRQTEHINKILFDIFGLSPEYKVVWTDKEWFEFYEPDFTFRYNYNASGYAPINDYPIKNRMHITEHQTKLDSGVVVSAKFAVHHASRTIYLQIVDIGGNRVWSMYGK
jgi:hypothetical protein